MENGVKHRMILIISICKEKLHELEFVKPIEDILKNNNAKFATKHYSKISKADLQRADKIIICGTSLKDNEYLQNLDAKIELLTEKIDKIGLFLEKEFNFKAEKQKKFHIKKLTKQEKEFFLIFSF